MDIGDGYGAIRLGHCRDEDSLGSELTEQQKVYQLPSVVRLLFDGGDRSAIGQPAQLLHFFV